jgi:hypothetical protein
MAVIAPPIKVTDDTDVTGIGSPNREICPLGPLVLDSMSSQLLVKTVMPALVEEIQVVFGQ